MSTIAAKLKNIINCKNAIRTSINNKGGKITENSKFSDYATAINNLSAGGGSGISSVDIVKPIYAEQKNPVPNTGHLEKIFFDTNGMAGFIFYSIVIICIVLFFLGYKLPATWILVICLGLPLLAIFLREPLTNLINKKPELIEGSKGMFFVESFFELFEILLSFLTNSLSFVRVGAFALSHAGLMSVVLMLAKAETTHPNIVVLVVGNLFVMGLEALSVAIQVLRLQFYEMFSRYYGGDGKPFKSYLTNK